MITAALVFGPSKVTITSKLGADFGFDLLWIVVVAIFFMVIFTAMAGYNPREAINLWKRMAAQANSQRPPEFLSTHPAEERRIQQLEQYLPEALKYYKPSRR